MPPPIASVSTRGTSERSTSIFVLTLAPPMIATNGCSGSSMMPPSATSSFSRSRPANAGSRCATPSVDACARCAVPNASFTYRSKPAASCFANAGSFRSSSGWKRTFSSITTSPGFIARTVFSTSGPTESGWSGTGRRRISARRFATGASVSFASGPFGRPRCETSPTAAPAPRSARRVGSAARMRVSSATAPCSSGTLKSTRTRTRFPRTSASRMVRLSKVTRVLAASGDRDAHLRGDELGDVGEAARVTPLVVVPRDDLDHVSEDDRVHRADDRGMRVPLEIARHERFLGVIHDSLERSLRRALERRVHLVLGHLTLQRCGEVDNRDRRRRYAEGHTGEAALQLRNDQRNGARGTCLGGHDVLRRRACVSWIAGDRIEQSLTQRLRMDRGEETLLDSELVVQHFRDRSQAVRGAGRVRNDVVLLGIELLLVDPEHDRLVLVLRGRRDDHVFRACVEVRFGLRRVGEESGRLDDDVDFKLLPRELRRIALLQHLDGAAVDDERVRRGRDVARVLPVIRIVLEEVSVHLRVGEVVQRDDLDLRMPLERRLQELAADPAEP